MIQVKNNQVVREVALITYRGNRKRNVLSVFALVLTTFMITTVIALGVSYWDTIQKRQLRMEGMDYDVELTEPRENQVELVRDMEEVKYAGLSVKCAIVEEYQGKMLDKARLYWVDDICFEKQVMPALEHCEGKYPEKEDEIMLSLHLLKAMGIEKPQIGMSLPLSYFTLKTNDEKEYAKEFTLCGFYSDYTGKNRGYVSKAFFETTGVKQTDFTQGALKIKLKDKLYTAKEMDEMSRALKFHSKQILIGNPEFIEEFLRMTGILAGMLVMIFASGYLFIFNTMYISISKDIRYYGQLKTMGMTSRQLKKIVYTQAFIHSVLGIPAGLLLAGIVTKQGIPKALSLINPVLDVSNGVTVLPGVFFIAGLFALATSFISVGTPAKIAGDCSPVEAMRHFAGGIAGKRRPGEGTSLYSMAFSNMFRDKKQAVVIFLSFVTGICVFCMMNEYILINDGKFILEGTSAWDMEIVNQTTLEEERQIFTEDMISEISALPGVKSVEKVSTALAKVPKGEEVFGEYFKELYGTRYAPGNYEEDMEKYRENPEGSFLGDAGFVAIGEEEFLELNKHVNQKVDEEEFFQGKAAVATKILTEGDDGMTGKTVDFYLPQGKNPKEVYSITIAGVDTEGSYNPAYFTRGEAPSIIVSENLAKKLIQEPYVEKLKVKYEKSYDKETEKEVKEIFHGENRVSFDSKIENYEEMRESESQAKVLGYTLGGIVGLLSICNYLNMMAASVLNRSKEFGILESIGMTTGQIKKVLRIEGVGYGLISILLALPFGLILSYLVFTNANMYRTSCALPWGSNLLLFAGVMAVCVLVPGAVYGRMYKSSVVEQLREGDI